MENWTLTKDVTIDLNGFNILSITFFGTNLNSSTTSVVALYIYIIILAFYLVFLKLYH